MTVDLYMINYNRIVVYDLTALFEESPFVFSSLQECIYQIFQERTVFTGIEWDEWFYLVWD